MQEHIKMASEFKAKIDQMNEEANKLKGRKVIVTSNYNGQSYGVSKKTLKGTTQVISGAVVDNYYGLMVSLVGYEYGCPYLEASEFQLVED